MFKHSEFYCSLPDQVRISKSVSFPDAIMSFSGGVLTVYGPNETASIFATYPSEFLSLGRSFLDQVSGRLHFLSPVSPWMLCPLAGRGHRPADAVHPGPGRTEKHSGSRGADSGHRGDGRAGDLHVNVRQLRRCHKSCSRSGAPPLHAERGLGPRGLHVSFRPHNSAVDAHAAAVWIGFAQTLNVFLKNIYI